ncbi:hypothetical protein [Persephonella sp.]
MYALTDVVFNLFNINNISFYTLTGGYDVSLKILTALVFQSSALTIYFKWIFKESFLPAILKSVFVSVFLYIFLYILLTGIYLRI